MSDQRIHDQSPVNQAETRKTTSLEKLKHWFGLLRKACEQDPRLVLRALKDPDKLTDYQSEEYYKAEALRWEVGGRERVEKQCAERGVDKVKALAVIDFLHAHAKSSICRPNESGELDTVLVPYYFRERELVWVQKIVESHEDPVAILKTLNGVVDFDSVTHRSIARFTQMAAGLAHNPKEIEVAKKIAEMSNIRKLNMNDFYGYMNFAETGIRYFGESDEKTVDPIQQIAQLDDAELQASFSDETKQQVSNLWDLAKTSEPMPMFAVPQLLKIAQDPMLSVGFQAVAEFNSDFYKRFIMEPIKFQKTVSKLERLCAEVPELIDLYKDGFNVHNYFQVGDKGWLNSNEPLLEFIKDGMQKAVSNETLRQNARILKNHHLEMRIDTVGWHGRDYVRDSDPDHLEKSLVVAQLFGIKLTDENAHEGYEYWASIKNAYKDYSIEEFTEAFSPLQELERAELHNLEITPNILLRDTKSLAEIKARVNIVLNPEMQVLIKDQIFRRIAFADQRPLSCWVELFQAPSEYVALYANRDSLVQRIQKLRENGLVVSASERIRPLKGLLLLSDSESEKLIGICKQELVSEIDTNTIDKFNAIQHLSDAEQAQLLGEFQKARFTIKSLLDDKISGETMQKYAELTREQKQHLWEILSKLKQRCLFTLIDSTGKNINFDFLCALTVDNNIEARLFAMLDVLETRTEEESNVDPLDGITTGDGKNSAVDSFIRLIQEHRMETVFNLDDYFNAEGYPTEKFLLELAQSGGPSSLVEAFLTKRIMDSMSEEQQNFWKCWQNFLLEPFLRKLILDNRSIFSRLWVKDGATSEFLEIVSASAKTNFDPFYTLLSNQCFANMDEQNRTFWKTWKQRGQSEKELLLRNKQEFNTLFVDGKPTTKFMKMVGEEYPRIFFNYHDLSKLEFDVADKRSILQALAKGIVDKKLCMSNFDLVMKTLKMDKDIDGKLDPGIKRIFSEALGFEVTDDFVTMRDTFLSQSQESRYDAPIPDRDAYWQQNLVMLAHLGRAHWRAPDFDRFRSLAQNPESRNILFNTESAYLQQLSSTIGLNIGNIIYTSEASLRWLKNNLELPGSIQFFRNILNTKPTSFNSCISTFASLGQESTVKILTSPVFTERLLEAMEEFKNITPSLVTGYIMENSPEKRQEYKQRITRFRKNVHRNVPVMTLATDSNGVEFMADMISLTFPGTNMDSVRRELPLVGDHCEDIANLTLREAGYKGKISSKEKIAKLRNPEQPVDDVVLNLVKEIFTKDQSPSYIAQGGDAGVAQKGWTRLISEAGATQQSELFKASLQEVIACARVSLGDKIDQYTERMQGDTSQVVDKNNVLAKAKELFGIYYKDNSAEAIDLFLEANPRMVDKFMGMLTEKKLGVLLRSGASKDASKQSKAELTRIVTGLQEQKNGPEARKLLAQLLAYLTEKSMFAGIAGLRKMIDKEMAKIVLSDKEGQEVDPSLMLTGYVTKNAASYYAKTTAGVCTAGDIALYSRKDHFHVNLVNNAGIVAGNIQGYQTEYDGRPALIFRGFNPSSSIVSTVNSAVLCDQMVEMVRQVAADNGITDVFVPEQDGWHPLTNRVGEGVGTYFQSKICKPENKVEFPFAITGTKTVTAFYRL